MKLITRFLILASIVYIVSCQKKEAELIDPTTPPMGEDTTKIPQDSILLLKSTTSIYDDGKPHTLAYIYDTQHRVTKMIEVDKDGKLIEILREFEYSGDKLIKSIENFNQHSTYIYTYTGDLITKADLDNGTKQYFTYDVNNNLILFVGELFTGGKDSVIYEGYINNRPTKSIQYTINKYGIINDTTQRRYIYDTDNNLTKTELLNTKISPTWRIEDEYFYDLKIIDPSPKMPFPNLQGIEGGGLGNPNSNSKDINKYMGNKYISYGSCFNKSQILNFTLIKTNKEGLPLEIENQNDQFNGCGDGSLASSKKSPIYIEYTRVKK